jgi:hypothetical protein
MMVYWEIEVERNGVQTQKVVLGYLWGSAWGRTTLLYYCHTKANGVDGKRSRIHGKVNHRKRGEKHGSFSFMFHASRSRRVAGVLPCSLMARESRTQS